MKKVLIGGVGNVLLGDDGVGPYVLRLLEAMYDFGPSVETIDLGTPALDLLYRIADLDLVLLIDAVENGKLAGNVTVYRKSDLIRHAPAVRMDPHSPALGESLLAAELLGNGPEEVVLIGVSVGNLDGGCALSPQVGKAVGEVVRIALEELNRHGVAYTRRFGIEPDIWWAQGYQPHLA